MIITLFAIVALWVLLTVCVAPVPGARTPPGGVKIDDGYQTLVNFAADSDVSLWEREITPPGLDGGEMIDTTTMHNVRWRTASPRQLIRMTPFSMECGYDPAVYDQLLAILNVETTLTVHFPNGGSLAFYGAMTNFEPGSLSEGGFPTATVTVLPTMQDPTTGEEEDPVYTPPA